MPQPHRPARPARPPRPQRARRGGAPDRRRGDDRPRWGVRLAAGLAVAVLGSGGDRARGDDRPGRRDRAGWTRSGHEEPAQAGARARTSCWSAPTDGTRSPPRTSAPTASAARPATAPTPSCWCTSPPTGSGPAWSACPATPTSSCPTHRDESSGESSTGRTRVKLNAAYAEGGPQLTVRTVESMTRREDRPLPGGRLHQLHEDGRRDGRRRDLHRQAAARTSTPASTCCRAATGSAADRPCSTCAPGMWTAPPTSAGCSASSGSWRP